jgi:hypothetical protein
VHYLGCESLSTPTSTVKCQVNSKGSTGGLILTNTLHAILGLILPSKRTGALFLPQSGATLVELEQSLPCTVATKITGNVVGELAPIGVDQVTGKTSFTLTAGVASVKDFDLTHGLGLVKPELNAFGEPAALSQTVETETSVATEIT